MSQPLDAEPEFPLKKGVLAFLFDGSRIFVS